VLRASSTSSPWFITFHTSKKVELRVSLTHLIPPASELPLPATSGYEPLECSTTLHTRQCHYYVYCIYTQYVLAIKSRSSQYLVIVSGTETSALPFSQISRQYGRLSCFTSARRTFVRECLISPACIRGSCTCTNINRIGWCWEIMHAFSSHIGIYVLCAKFHYNGFIYF